MEDLILEEEVYAVVGAAIEVHRELGCGYSEGIYQEGLEIEMESREIPFEAQKELRIAYKGTLLKKHFCVDFLCFGQIVVEIKALDRLTGREGSQILNYLKATGHRRSPSDQLRCPRQARVEALHPRANSGLRTQSFFVFFVPFVDEV